MINRILALLGRCVLAPILRARKNLRFRFAVNQVAAQSHGWECAKGIVTIEIEPNQVTPTQRRLLEQRLMGINVCEGVLRADGSRGPRCGWERDTYQDASPAPILLVAELPNLEGLLKAVIRDERRLLEMSVLRGGPRALVASDAHSRHRE